MTTYTSGNFEIYKYIHDGLYTHLNKTVVPYCVCMSGGRGENGQNTSWTVPYTQYQHTIWSRTKVVN